MGCHSYRSKKKRSKGFGSIVFIAFLLIFISIFVFLGAQYATAPAPVTGQATIKYYPNGTSYLIYTSDRGTASISNIPTLNASSLTCGFGWFGVDGLVGCAYNYAHAFVVFTQMSSDNTLLTILIGILILILAWSVATLWGGSGG